MLMRTVLHATLFCAVLFVAAGARPAHATTLAVGFGHGVGNLGCLGGPGASHHSETPFTLSQECETVGQGPSFATGTVGPGHTSTTLSVTLTGGLQNTGTAGVSWVGSYVVIGEPEPVRTFYRVRIDGILATSPCLARHCVALVEVNSNSGHELHREYLATDGEDLEIAEALRSASFTVIPDIPFAVGWRIDAFVSMNAGIGRAAVNFQNTVSFVEAGPVFDLPEGYTVNGPCIEDNRFVCGAAAAVPVPLAASGMLLGTGLAGVAAATCSRALRAAPRRRGSDPDALS